MKSSRVACQIKATEQYFTVLLFIMLYQLILTFEAVMKGFNTDQVPEKKSGL